MGQSAFYNLRELLQKHHKAYVHWALCLTQVTILVFPCHPTQSRFQPSLTHPTESKASQVIKTLNKRHGFCVVILICYLTGSFVLMGILYQTISNYSSCLFLPPNQWYMLPIWNRFSLCPFYLQIILRLYL